MADANAVFGSEPVDGGVVAIAKVDINLKSSPAVRAYLLEVVKGGHSRVIIDLGGVMFMDSSGVATLVEVLREQRARGGKLVLCNLQNRVLSIFKISRLDSVFTIAADRDAAMSV